MVIDVRERSLFTTFNDCLQSNMETVLHNCIVVTSYQLLIMLIINIVGIVFLQVVGIKKDYTVIADSDDNGGVMLTITKQH